MEVEDCFDRCVREEYGRLVRIVSVVTGSVALAEDSVQEAFARAWERVARGEEFVSLSGWVVRVAVNHARSRWRRSVSELEVVRRLGNAALIAGCESDPALVVTLRDAVAGLPGRQRDAVVLYYLVDLDVATVAAELGVSVGTVKTALARARTKLAARLEIRTEEQR